ncbi:MAG: hypothetical protein K2W99_04250 [Chthoniobacterales bacterium]|nr:hypothetical protein [Chthoniobacterales bacterium]
MSFPNIPSSSSAQGNYSTNSQVTSSRSPVPSNLSHGDAKSNSDAKFDPQTGAPIQRESVSSNFDPQAEAPIQQESVFSNQGETTENMANVEQARVQGATQHFGLQSGVTAEIGTEEEFDLQNQFDQEDQSIEDQAGGYAGSAKTEAEPNQQKGNSVTGEAGGARKSSSGFSSGRSGPQLGAAKGLGGGIGRGSERGRGSEMGIGADPDFQKGSKAGLGTQEEVQQAGAAKEGTSSLGSHLSSHAGVKNSAILGDLASSVVQDNAYSIAKSVTDAIYGAAYGAVNTAKTAYVDANGVPPIFPPTDTFNVYVAECEAETLSNNTQWISIQAQVDAINGMSLQQEAAENTYITNTLNAIAQQAAAAAAGRKAQQVDQITMGVSIGVAVLMIVASAACYATGVGALGAGEMLDAEAGAEIGTAVAASAAETTAEDVTTKVVVDEAVDTGVDMGGREAITDSSEELTEDLEVVNNADSEADITGNTADRSAMTRSSAQFDAANANDADSEADVTEGNAAGRVAITSSEEGEAEATTAQAASKSMTLDQLASWQFMGVSSLLMSIPQVGGAAMDDLTKSLEEDGVPSQDASWIAMAIITVSMIAAGGLVSALGNSERLSLLLAGKAADTAATTGATSTVEAASTVSEEETVSTLSYVVGGLQKSAKGIQQGTESFVTNLGKLTKVASQSVQEAVTTLLTDPVTAIATVGRVMGSMLMKIGAGFYKLGPDLSAFGEITTASSSKAAASALAKAVGSCLPMITSIGQSVDVGLSIYQSNLDLQEAIAMQHFAQDSSAALTSQAYANSIESSIQACNQALNTMIQVTDSMMASTEQTVGGSQQPIAS